MVSISPLVSGHIKYLYVDEGDHVKKGDILAKIDDRDYRVQVELRKAEVERVKRELERANISLIRIRKDLRERIKIAGKGLIEAQETLKKAIANFERVKKDYNRFKKLSDKGAIATSKFDAIKAEYETLRAEVKRAQALVELKRAQLERAKIGKYGVEEVDKTVKALRSALKSAKKGLDAAVLNLKHTEIKSPIDAVIAKKFFNEGDFVSPGLPVFSLYDTTNLFIIANLEETKTKGVKLNQEVDIWVDAFPSLKIKGKVIKIGKATGSEFALIPRDVSAGEFTKVVQRVPIKISIPDDMKSSLKPGLSVTIGIKVK
jgi:membrane fusion protein (multidrug efflux system)